MHRTFFDVNLYKSIHDFYTIFKKTPNFGQADKITKTLINAITAAFAAILKII